MGITHDDDPDLKAARDEHDQQSGIGPRNVAKNMGGDHSPELTRREEGLTGVLDEAVDRLVRGLAEVLAR